MTGFNSKRSAARERFMVCEDPMYDEDGVLVDEDYEEPNGWFDIDVAKKPQEENSPFNTVNS